MKAGRVRKDVLNLELKPQAQAPHASNIGEDASGQ